MVVLVGVVGLGAAWLMGSRLLVRPITDLVEAAEAIGRGESSTRLSDTARVTELARLGRAFNAMADDLEERERGLVQLTSDLRNSNRDLEQFSYVASTISRNPCARSRVSPTCSPNGTGASSTRPVCATSTTWWTEPSA